MSEARPVWQEFDPSTFTFVARNDIAVNWVLNYREANRLPPTREVLLLGSGMVEPFTLAALSPDIKVTAVELNEDLIEIGESVKRGQKVLWDVVAEKALNPGRPNTDFLEEERLVRSLSVLEHLGSLEALGRGFGLEGIKVDPSVADRVTFIKADALSAVKILESKRFDLIGDFFLRVNVNKHKSGPAYTAEMLRYSFDLLNDNGMLLIGDTGRNLPVTYQQFADLDTTGRLNLSSAVHFVNFGSGKTTSHYLLATKLTEFPSATWLASKAQNRLMNNPVLDALTPVAENSNPSLVAKASSERINLAYVDTGKAGESYMWNSALSQAEAFDRIVPNAGDEASETIIFDAQKPYLQAKSR
jgi:hypothetical protein